MVRSAVGFALVATVGWGLWAVLADLATRTIAPAVAMVLSYAAGTALVIGYVVLRPGSVALTQEGVAFAVASGLVSGIGAAAFYAGLARGRAGIVTTISALYFVVAAAVGILVLGETVDARDLAGIAFAVLAVLLLAR